MMRVVVVSAVVMPLSFYLGSHWGTVGIASAWIVVYPVLALPLYWWTFRRLELSTFEYLRALAPAFTGSVAMTAAVLALKWSFPEGWSLALQLGAEILLGALTYSLAVMTFHRERVFALYEFLRSARRQE